MFRVSWEPIIIAWWTLCDAVVICEMYADITYYNIFYVLGLTCLQIMCNSYNDYSHNKTVCIVVLLSAHHNSIFIITNNNLFYADHVCSLTQTAIKGKTIITWVCILVQVTIYGRLQIDRDDDHCDQSEAYDIS